MNVAALFISIISALAAVTAAFFGKRGVDAAKIATAMEKERRHAEMRPRYLVTCQAPAFAGGQTRLVVKLTGPGELEELNELTVTIRDDNFFRLKPASTPGQAPDSVNDHVWGPLRFVPSTGPGVGTRPGAVGADAAGRATTTVGLPVGEEHVYVLQATFPPSHSNWNEEHWRDVVGVNLKFRVEGRKDGWEPWIAVGELDASEGEISVAIT